MRQKILAVIARSGGLPSTVVQLNVNSVIAHLHWAEVSQFENIMKDHKLKCNVGCIEDPDYAGRPWWLPEGWVMDETMSYPVTIKRDKAAGWPVDDPNDHLIRYNFR